MSGQLQQEKPLGVNIVVCLKKCFALKESSFKFVKKKSTVFYLERFI